MDFIVPILTTVLGTAFGFLLKVIWDSWKNRTRWHTTGISASFEKADDGGVEIKSIMLEFKLTNHGTKRISIKSIFLNVMKKGFSVATLIPNKFTPVNLEGDETRKIKVNFLVSEDLSSRIGRLETAKNGFIITRVSLVDNDAEEKTSTTIAYEGGIKKFIEKYGYPGPKNLKTMLDNAEGSAIWKN